MRWNAFVPFFFFVRFVLTRGRAVNRIGCKAENYDLVFKVDINTGIYPLNIGDKLTLALGNMLC